MSRDFNAKRNVRGCADKQCRGRACNTEADRLNPLTCQMGRTRTMRHSRTSENKNEEYSARANPDGCSGDDDTLDGAEPTESATDEEQVEA